MAAASYSFCAPSVTLKDGMAEAFGNVFTEAQALGLPVVAYNSGGIPETMLEGQTGLLAREGDVNTLGLHIARYLTDTCFWRIPAKQDCAGFGSTLMFASRQLSWNCDTRKLFVLHSNFPTLRPKVLIFKEDILPVSETFIKAQVEALMDFQPQMVGLGSANPSLQVTDNKPILLSTSTSLLADYIRKVYRRTGIAPAFHHQAAQVHASLLHAHFAQRWESGGSPC